MKNISFVVIGGGTGTYSVLSGLKKYTDNITAVVSMADSGGSAKKERDEWGLLPSSDIRKSLVALSDVSTQDNLLLRQLFSYRYRQGKGLTGMTFGNLFLVTLTKLLHSQKKAIIKAGELLKIKGKVLPVTFSKINLVATYEDGRRVVGEHAIDEPRHNGSLRIVKLETKPKAKTTRDVLAAINNCDMLIIGPGGFYTTLIPNLLIEGVREAIEKSKAKKIFILNLMTEYGQTFNYTAKDFLEGLHQYLNTGCLDYILINNNSIAREILKKYRKSNAQPVVDDLPRKKAFRIISTDLLSTEIIKKVPGDKLKRSLIRHNPDKIARVCLKIADLL